MNLPNFFSLIVFTTEIGMRNVNLANFVTFGTKFATFVKFDSSEETLFHLIF